MAKIKKLGGIDMLNLELFESRLERTVSEGQLVGVHWNSHKNCFSIVAMKSRNTIGHVLGYADNVQLENTTFKIDKTKQKNVRENGVKDRHAFVVGRIVGFEPAKYDGEIFYNPFKFDKFMTKSFENGEFVKGEFVEMSHADIVAMTSEKNKPIVTMDWDRGAFGIFQDKKIKVGE